MESTSTSQRLRFGKFELDLRAGELRNNGFRRRLQDQPRQILETLLRHPGDVVTREELRQELWPKDTFVDFDHSLNTAVKKLRQALDDDPDAPHFIETIPRRGYRFIAAVEPVNGAAHANGGAAVTATPSAASPDVRSAEVEKAAVSGSVIDPGTPFELKGRGQKSADRGYRLAIALSLAAILVAAGLWIYRSGFTRRASVHFNARDWVLVSRFENRTGNPVLDGSVDFAVAQELSNSQFVNVVPPERVGDALRLMEKPLNTLLTPAVARQVCLRDGGIRALITGRVEKIGNTFVLSAGIVDPATDVQVAGVESQAADLDGILPAVRQLSNQVRAALGEGLPAIQESNLKLEKVTTPSLRALQLYSQADAIAIEQGPLEKPIPLLEQALADDPNFASAHILLAWCFSNIGKWTLAAPHFQKAFELASTVSELERLFILGSYYGRFKGDDGRAIQEYEALARLYPDDYWGTGNLTALYYREGRRREAAEILARRADLRPTDFQVNAIAWEALSNSGLEAEAQPFFLRAKKLVTPEIEKEEPGAVFGLRVGISQADLRAGKIKAALDMLQLAGAGAPQGGPDLTLILSYREFGKLKLAQEWLNRIPPDDPMVRWRPTVSAENAYQRGDLQAERKILEHSLTESNLHDGDLAVKFARCGMLRKAKQQVSRYDKWYATQKVKPYWGPELGEGSLALAEGRYDEAIRLLTKAAERSSESDAEAHDPPADDLATAYEREGRIADAIHALEPLEAKHDLNPIASFHLYKLYLKAGEAREAQQVRAELLHRLAYADLDYPVLVELRHEEDHRVAALAKQ